MDVRRKNEDQVNENDDVMTVSIHGGSATLFAHFIQAILLSTDG